MKVTPKKSDYEEMKKQIDDTTEAKSSSTTYKTVFHKANTRGYANHGWLEARHTFSFANYYNPDRVHFGALRVLNDDSVAGGMGFGTHPHDNMEIITIPLEGALAHKDSMGNGTTIQAGDIQVMSAGTGILHSEFNAKKESFVKLLQIWVFPNKKQVEPRYQQITLNKEDLKNRFFQIVSPNPEDEGVWIHQNAWFHLGDLDENKTFEYELKDKNNGVYFFLMEGLLEIENQTLEVRDGFGIWETEKVTIKTKSTSKLLIMEVPMNLN